MKDSLGITGAAAAAAAVIVYNENKAVQKHLAGALPGCSNIPQFTGKHNSLPALEGLRYNEVILA